jgi:hypothetical protein
VVQDLPTLKAFERTGALSSADAHKQGSHDQLRYTGGPYQRMRENEHAPV